MFRKRDPVCGAKVSKNTEHFLKHGDEIYYFDSQACKITFQENPDRFLRKKSAEGFLKWLAKRKEQVPKSCHEFMMRLRR